MYKMGFFPHLKICLRTKLVKLPDPSPDFRNTYILTQIRTILTQIFFNSMMCNFLHLLLSGNLIRLIIKLVLCGMSKFGGGIGGAGVAVNADAETETEDDEGEPDKNLVVHVDSDATTEDDDGNDKSNGGGPENMMCRRDGELAEENSPFRAPSAVPHEPLIPDPSDVQETTVRGMTDMDTGMLACELDESSAKNLKDMPHIETELGLSREKGYSNDEVIHKQERLMANTSTEGLGKPLLLSFRSIGSTHAESMRLAALCPLKWHPPENVDLKCNDSKDQPEDKLWNASAPDDGSPNQLLNFIGNQTIFPEDSPEPDWMKTRPAEAEKSPIRVFERRLIAGSSSRLSPLARSKQQQNVRAGVGDSMEDAVEVKSRELRARKLFPEPAKASKEKLASRKMAAVATSGSGMKDPLPLSFLDPVSHRLEQQISIDSGVHSPAGSVSYLGSQVHLCP
jgi:hypothetical protein